MILNDKIVTKILFISESDQHYGLRFLFELEDNYLYFDSFKFTVVSDKAVLQLYNWKEITYPRLKDHPTIVQIKEDESGTYFIEFSNSDILHIHQRITLEEFWIMDFEIVKTDDGINYEEVKAHMLEDFVSTIFSKNG